MSEQLLRDYYRAYNREDPAALAAFYHEDVVLESAQGTLRGVDAILATYRYLTANFRDRMCPGQIVVDGDTVTVNILDTFTAKQDVPEFMGESLAAGDVLRLRLRGTYLIADGRFRAIRIEALGAPQLTRRDAAD